MPSSLVSFAQNAEDIVLARGLTGSTGFWVDVGAFHPTIESVTKLFADRGWRGVNVDPIKESIELFERERPRDINVHAAISDRPGTISIWSNSSLFGHSTAEPDIAAAHTAEGIEFAQREVTAMTLTQLLDSVVPLDTVIDFLKVDVEGHEGSVLASNDWSRWRPRVVVVEAVAPYRATSAKPEWEHLVLGAGYGRVLFDGLNCFYVRDDETELRDRMSVPANILDAFETHQYALVRDAYQQAMATITQLDARLRDTAAELDDCRRALLSSGRPRGTGSD